VGTEGERCKGGCKSKSCPASHKWTGVQTDAASTAAFSAVKFARKQYLGNINHISTDTSARALALQFALTTCDDHHHPLTASICVIALTCIIASSNIVDNCMQYPTIQGPKMTCTAGLFMLPRIRQTAMLCWHLQPFAEIPTPDKWSPALRKPPGQICSQSAAGFVLPSRE